MSFNAAELLLWMAIVLFSLGGILILAGSFIAPGSVAAIKGECSPAYGVDPCSTGSIDH